MAEPIQTTTTTTLQTSIPSPQIQTTTTATTPTAVLIASTSTTPSVDPSPSTLSTSSTSTTTSATTTSSFSRNPLHHPAVEVIQHITSPLTSALCIFGVYKASHLPKIRSWWKATSIIWKAQRAARQRTAENVSPVYASGSIANSIQLQQQRQYSTVRNVSSNMQGIRNLHHSTASFSLFSRQIRSYSNSSNQSYRSLLTPSSMNQAKSPFLSTNRLFSTSLSRNSAAIATTEVKDVVSTSTDAVNSAVNGHEAVHTFFPDSFYVMSPFTGADVVFTSEKIQHLINACHVDFGMPWWQSMIAVTLAFRFIVLPINVSLVRNTLRLYINKPKIVELSKKMDEGSPSEKLDSAIELKNLFKTTKCHPIKNIISPILFPPMFLSLFGAVYDISTHHPESVIGGTLWFQNLAQPDPTFILPVVSALTWLATIEMASGEHFPLKPWILSATRLGAIACIPITMTLPAGVFLFWITSNLFACCRALVVRQPPVARLFGVPVIPKKPVVSS